LWLGTQTVCKVTFNHFLYAKSCIRSKEAISSIFKGMPQLVLGLV
jgi:hypothetical protein